MVTVPGLQLAVVEVNGGRSGRWVLPLASEAKWDTPASCAVKNTQGWFLCLTWLECGTSLNIKSVVSVTKLGFSCLSDRAQEVYTFREMYTSGACFETN